MKLKKEMVEYISRTLINSLVKEEYILIFSPLEKIRGRIENLIIDDLQVEDRLNEEVKELLKSVQDKIEDGSLNYHRMFNMVKNKLIRERELIL